MLPAPDKSECVLILLRHGATENNVANPPILQGNAVNGCLSEQGRQQAAATRAALADLPIQAVYSSSLLRAQETASIVAAPHGLPIGTIDNIHEVDVGDWEGRSWVNIATEDREAYENFMSDPATHGYLNGESFADVHKRVMPALERTMERHKGEVVLVVAHNVVNRVILAAALRVELRESRAIPQDNCGVNILKFSAEPPKVKALNSILHLP